MTTSIRIRHDDAFITDEQCALLAQELRSELARTERRLRQNHDDDAAASPSRATQAALARRAALQDALARIDDGRYGRCTACDGAIPFGRLLVMPEAASCLRCRGLA